MKTKTNFCDRCLFAINIYYDTHCAMMFNPFNHINVCISPSWFHIYDRTVHNCTFACCMPPCRWPKKAETCSRITTCLYTVVSNYSVVVGIRMVICLTARNMDNFKFKDPSLFQESTNQYFVSPHVFLRTIFHALSSIYKDSLPDVQGLGIKLA